jgi:glycerol-3-phosphate dehydrogenase
MSSSPTRDLAVLGGGITGAAVASEAARRGFSVWLTEKGDFASGTSSRSSKLIHGGQRYLESFEWRLVRESCVERARLARMAPHLVRPLPFLFSVGQEGAPPKALLALGLAFYRALAAGEAPGPTRFLRNGNAILSAEAPGLAPGGASGAYRYFDAQADDALLTLAYLRDAAGRGAELRSHCAATKILRDRRGAACGVEAEDRRTGEKFSIPARLVVAALGPWSNGVGTLAGEDFAPTVRPSRGSHFFLPAGRLPLAAAVVLLDRDGRRCYALPWRGGTLLGTTDSPDSGSPDAVAPTDEDRDRMLEAAARYFPGARLAKEDVAGGFAGLRPLAAPASSRAAEALSREDRLHEPLPRLLVSVGGKLTTARATAARVLDRAERLLARDFGRRPSPGPFAAAPLPGGSIADPAGLRAEVRAEGFRRVGLSEAQADRVFEREGDAALAALDRMAREPELARPLSSSLPYTYSDLVWGVEQGGARTADDLLSRRVRLAWESPEEAVRAVPLAEEALARYRPRRS